MENFKKFYLTPDTIFFPQKETTVEPIFFLRTTELFTNILLLLVLTMIYYFMNHKSEYLTDTTTIPQTTTTPTLAPTITTKPSLYNTDPSGFYLINKLYTGTPFLNRDISDNINL